MAELKVYFIQGVEGILRMEDKLREEDIYNFLCQRVKGQGHTSTLPILNLSVYTGLKMETTLLIKG